MRMIAVLTVLCSFNLNCFATEIERPESLGDTEEVAYLSVVKSLASMDQVNKQRVHEVYGVPAEEELVVINYQVIYGAMRDADQDESTVIKYTLALKSSAYEVKDSVLRRLSSVKERTVKYSVEYQIDIQVSTGFISIKKTVFDVEKGTRSVDIRTSR